MAATPPLANLLANRHWTRASDPFPYVWAEDVFRADFYGELEAGFREILDRGFAERATPERFARSMPGYDAYGVTFAPGIGGPLSVFTTRPWHDLIGRLMGVEGTGQINCGLHHHAVGSASGTVHNDLNPGWFVDYPSDDGINLTRHDVCSYTTGEAHVPGVTPREQIRAVAVLFYLANPPWSPGDGGATGLYRSQSDPVEAPAATVPPVNNSMVIFECTPFSFHTFLSNRRSPRNSLVMWLHRPKAEAVARWGERAIVYWKKR